jgi:periplasmic divalent cation tolerance protein
MDKKNAKPMIVFTTVPKKNHAVKIAKALLGKKLAACVTTLPAGESRYVWKGKLCIERDYVLMIKTLEAKYPQLEKALRAVHPYECPEIVGVPVKKILPAYHRWLTSNVKI